MDRSSQPLVALLEDLAEAGFARFREGLVEEGLGDIRPGHGCVFRFVEPGGSRLTDLAERSGFTKQAVGEAVSDLEQLGYVARVPDPVDKRAKLITVTEQGERALETGRRIFDEIEREWARRIGRDKVDVLREAAELLLAEPPAEKAA
jgi:DNA-binding MarR family transcriptional regulator